MKILVALHIYYQNQADYFAGKFKNLADLDADFVITTHLDSPDLRAAFAPFSPRIMIVPNHGLDVGPFFYALENSDISKYDFVIKLHAKRIVRRGYKRNSNGWYALGRWWRDLNVESLIGSPGIILENLQKFADNPDVNMICDPYHLISVQDKTKPLEEYIKMSRDFGLNPPLTRGDRYVEGTMFMARMKIFPPLLKKIHFSDFKKSNLHDRFSDNLPFFMERYFGAMGARVMPGARNASFERRSKFLRLRHIIFQNFQTNSGKHVMRFLGIPIWWKRAPDFN